ncbi:hypothetical protein [Clavibacter sp. Sh2088]|uniref:hypothetical protein n=1 Tax=Clavibacter sp. Sh2088 TaxID=3397676 RepID=UPI0039DF7C3B
MTADRRAAYARLLRWYPARWRRADGDVMLDTLEEHADAEGRARPTRGEAWSLRAHGLLERVTPRAILVLAGVALVLAVALPAAMLTGALLGSPVLLAMPWAAALLATVALLGLVGRSGVLRAESALAAAALAVPSWILGGFAAAAWSVGFDEADAGVPQGAFGSAFGALALAAWLLGAASLAVVLAGLLGIRSAVARWIVAVVVALPGALLVGVVALSSGAVALALAALIASARHRARGHGSRTAAGSASAPVAHAPLSAPGRRTVVTTALVGSALGLACAAFALAGSVWVPAVGDATDAMRVGIAIGSVVAILPVVAGAAALRPRMGRVVIPAAVCLGAAFLTNAVSYSAPDVDAAPEGYLQVAAVLVGLAGTSLLLPVLPGGRVVRVVLTVGVTIGIAAFAGMIVAVTGTFVAPVLGVVTAVLVSRRSRAGRRPQPA